MDTSLPLLCGIVSHGRGLGHFLGFPTANISADCGRALEHGVYLASVEYDGVSYPAVANIGVAPSVSQTAILRAEFHILDFDGDLYGRFIRAELIRFVRPEKKFSSEDELKIQIDNDIAYARKYFGFPAR